MRVLLLFLLGLGFLNANAQDLSYEQQILYLADGRALQGWLSLDIHKDAVFFKRNVQDQPIQFSANEIERFKFQGEEYVGLPYHKNLYTLFKVRLEGAQFAVLEKVPVPFFMGRIHRKYLNDYVYVGKPKDEAFYVRRLIRGNSSSFPSTEYTPSLASAAVGGNSRAIHLNGHQYTRKSWRKYQVNAVIYLAVGNTLDYWSLSLSKKNKPLKKIKSKLKARDLKAKLRVFELSEEKIKEIVRNWRKNKVDVTHAEGLTELLGSVYP